ncbi:MAG: DUF4440 domain-containing protein [Gemmatimonadota bacterium]|nr:DUF4440 domain-containing protein [Gemmatimonadota bacterium]
MADPRPAPRQTPSPALPKALLNALAKAPNKALREALVSAVAILTMSGCTSGPAAVNAVERVVAERAIRNEVVAAYDLTRPDVPGNLMSLYAPTGPIRSASGGRVIASRDSIRAGIDAFWTNVGRNMRDPHVEWTRMDIDVLAPGVAVMTATYRIPHRQPNGLAHVIGGAWTAVFVLRDGRWYITEEHLSDDPAAT